LLAQAIEPRIEVDNYSVLLELARRSLGIARVAHNLVKKDLASGRLVRVLPGYKCVYPDGELPGLWVLYPNRRVLIQNAPAHRFPHNQPAGRTLESDPFRLNRIRL
jgi:DNA-binding transcriptional LysR family regulator